MTPSNLDLGQLGGRWLLDSSSSSVKVAHKTMWGLVSVRGEFKEVAGEIEVDPSGAASGTITIAAASIDTGNKKRDAHLRSGDFFNAETHPTIPVVVSGTLTAGSAVQIDATVTVAGNSHQLSFVGQLTQSSPEALTVTAETSLDRNHVGLTWNQLGMMRDVTAVSVIAAFRRAA